MNRYPHTIQCIQSWRHFHFLSFSLVTHPCDTLYNGGCQQSCNKRGNRYFCSCDVAAGYKLAKDGKSCLHVHPCDKKANGGCDHKCNKKGIFFHCSCRKGFKLSRDGKTCDKVHPCDMKSKAGCAQKCLKDGLKAQCACNKGFILAEDKVSCRKRKWYILVYCIVLWFHRMN